MGKYDRKKVVELKAILRKRGLTVSGLKSELIERLEDDDISHSSYSSSSSEQPTKKRSLPSPSSSSFSSSEEVPKKKKQKTTHTASGSSKGKMKVDEDFPYGGTVFDDYGCMLNQVNISQNNNKFYKMQLIQDGSSFYTYFKFGRVGERGKPNLKGPLSQSAGVAAFKKQFKLKTGNEWDNRDRFVPKAKKYEIIELDNEDEDLDEMNQALESLSKSSKRIEKKVKPCTLDPSTKKLIQLIFDNDMFKSQMKHFQLDIKKLPLGKLSKKQIERGFEILEELSDAIDNGDRRSLSRLSSRFYTHVPHSFKRRQVPPVISDPEVVQQKKDMLNVLSDIVIAQNLIQEKEEESDSVAEVDHPMNVNYDALKCDVVPVPQDTSEYQKVADYLDATMGDFDLELEDLFEVRRHGEEDRFSEFDHIENRKLLWHGTNVAVVVAILSGGLRIMPHSGGRVGKGIYFASENSKSACYVGCAGQTGIMFLGEVALGKEHIITRDDPSLKKAPKGYDSVLAKGWTEPDPTQDSVIEIDGKPVTIPQGKPINIPEYASSNFTQSEYLVYKESQNRLRYLLKLKFKNKRGYW